MILIRALVESEDVTAIVATHDPILIDIADRVIELRDGQIVSDSAEMLDEQERYSVHR